MLRTKQSLLNKTNRTLEVAPSLRDLQKVNTPSEFDPALSCQKLDKNKHRWKHAATHTHTHRQMAAALNGAVGKGLHVSQLLLRYSSDPTKVTQSGTKKRLCLGVLKGQALALPDKKERKPMDSANYDEVKGFCR